MGGELDILELSCAFFCKTIIRHIVFTELLTPQWTNLFKACNEQKENVFPLSFNQ